MVELRVKTLGSSTLGAVISLRQLSQRTYIAYTASACGII